MEILFWLVCFIAIGLVCLLFKLKKKALAIVLLVLSILITSVARFCLFSGNKEAMLSCYSAVENTLLSQASVSELDTGEYSSIQVYGLMNFEVEQFYIENLGNLSSMTVHLGPMQMMTYVITPTEKDMPLMSLDYIYVGSTRKLYVEFYGLPTSDAQDALAQELEAVFAEYSQFEELEMDAVWYDDLMLTSLHKSTSSAEDSAIEALSTKILDAYLSQAAACEVLSEEDSANKIATIRAYCNGLITQGGTSTDVFKAQLGEEETRVFFESVFFGIGTE